MDLSQPAGPPQRRVTWLMTTTEKPAPSHLVELPAGVSAIPVTVLIDPPRSCWQSLTAHQALSLSRPASELVWTTTELCTATTRACGNCATSRMMQTASPRGPAQADQLRRRQVAQVILPAVRLISHRFLADAAQGRDSQARACHRQWHPTARKASGDSRMPQRIFRRQLAGAVCQTWFLRTV